jgi:hypothetical protein
MPTRPSGIPKYHSAKSRKVHPNVVLLPSESYVFAEAHAVDVRAALPGMPAEFVDGRDLFWWGIRTPNATGRLSKK